MCSLNLSQFTKIWFDINLFSQAILFFFVWPSRLATNKCTSNDLSKIAILWFYVRYQFKLYEIECSKSRLCPIFNKNCFFLAHKAWKVQPLAFSVSWSLTLIQHLTTLYSANCSSSLRMLIFRLLIIYQV